MERKYKSRGNVVSAYPCRDQYYAHKLTRLLFKSCAAQSIGQDAVLLIIHIAHTEDAARYQGPVRFWNSQLNEVLGFRSPKSLNNARAKAVAAGWLVYERPNDRADGRYWTCIPSSVLRFDDSPIEPFIDTLSVPSTEHKTEHKMEQETSYPFQVRNTKRNGKRNRKVTGNDSLPNPIPNPIPNTGAALSDFELWYSNYPKKKGRDAAEKAYPKAIEKIQRMNKVSHDEAVERLLQWTVERLPELLATESQFQPYPATWLNKGFYRDELNAAESQVSIPPVQFGNYVHKPKVRA